MSANMIRNKREQFHIEIRRKTLECTFKLKRLIAAPKHYPIEQLIDIVDRLIRNEKMNDDEFDIMNSILDDAQYTAVNEPEQFNEWAEHLRLIQTLVDSMYLASNPKYSVIATKAANCFRQLVKQKKRNVYVDEHFDQVCDIYKTWIDSDSSLLKENGLRGMTQLVELSGPRFQTFDFVNSVLKSLQINKNNDKALSLLAAITKNIEDDNQVIAILRIASRLIDNVDTKLKEKGLMILENASRNVQNIQFILTMRVMQSVISLVYYREKIISRLAMAIVVNLTYTYELDDCSKLIDLGILDVVYKLMKNSVFTYYRVNGSMIFNNLMAQSHIILDKIVENDKLLTIVFELLDNDVVDVRREIYHAFKNFLVVCSIGQLLKMIDTGLLDYEIAGLSDIDHQIVALSLETLQMIMRNLHATEYQMDIYGYFERKNVPRQIHRLQYHEITEIFSIAEKFIREFYDSEFYDPGLDQ